VKTERIARRAAIARQWRHRDDGREDERRARRSRVPRIEPFRARPRMRDARVAAPTAAQPFVAAPPVSLVKPLQSTGKEFVKVVIGVGAAARRPSMAL
jgi:hypothetical protein